MIEKVLEIKNKLGLHARAASVFVKTASSFSSEITVSNPNKEANGKNIMSMMLLQAAYGSEIKVEVTGNDEEAAMEAISAIIENKFGEPE